MLFVLLFAGSCAVLAGDFAAASAAKRFRFSYGWYVPFSWALYALIGYIATRQLSLSAAVSVGALIGFVDGTVGSLIAHRIGVMQWKRDRTRLELLAGGVAIALMCALLAWVGGTFALRSTSPAA